MTAGTLGPAAAPGASTEPPTVELTLMAKGIEFQPAMLSVPTGTKLIVAFENGDPGTPHALVLYADPAGTIKLAEAPIIVGPDHERYEVASLVVGRYRFSCKVHPNMAADLVVSPS